MRQPRENTMAHPLGRKLESHTKTLKIVGFRDFQLHPSHIGEGLVRVDVSWFVLCARE